MHCDLIESWSVFPWRLNLIQMKRKLVSMMKKKILIQPWISVRLARELIQGRSTDPCPATNHYQNNYSYYWFNSKEKLKLGSKYWELLPFNPWAVCNMWGILFQAIKANLISANELPTAYNSRWSITPLNRYLLHVRFDHNIALFTRGQFWPSGIVVVASVCVPVCVSITCLSAR